MNVIIKYLYSITFYEIVKTIEIYFEFKSCFASSYIYRKSYCFRIMNVLTMHSNVKEKYFFLR